MLLDPGASWALLVGTSSYPRSPDLADIPAVRNNLRDLRDALVNPANGLLYPNQCVVIEDPDDEHVVASALDEVAAMARDTLVVYYTGHGLIDDAAHPSLYLGLTQTTQSLVISNGLPFAVLRNFIGHSSAKRRVVILDCCYSGMAVEEGPMGKAKASDLVQLVPVEGSYVLTSSAATRTSMAPAGAHYTAFTEELLRVFTEGIPGGPRELDLETVYLHVRDALTRRELPEPQRLISNTAHRLALVLNPAWASTRSTPVDDGKRLGSRAVASPTAGRRWVALEMKRLRVAAELSQSQVANALGWPLRWISLIESGQRNIERDDLDRLLELFDVAVERRPQYIGAAEVARTKGWWEEYRDHTLPAYNEVMIGLEQGADRIRGYQSAVIYGLLQVPEYSTALIREVATYGEERVQRIVQVRVQRQMALLRDVEPINLWVVLDEAALHHRVGSDEVMQSQLQHVVDVATTRPNVTVQIIPFGRGAAEAAYGGFTIFSFPFPNDPGVVHIEQRGAGLLLEDVAEIDNYSFRFGEISKRALGAEESVEMLRAFAERYGA